jgi:hypothetical protein
MLESEVTGNVAAVDKITDYIDTLIEAGELDPISAIQYLRLLFDRRDITLSRFQELLKEAMGNPSAASNQEGGDKTPSPFGDNSDSFGVDEDAFSNF